MKKCYFKIGNDYAVKQVSLDYVLQENETFELEIKVDVEQLRQQKLTEANQVFDEYRRILTEASIEGLITGEINPHLVGLTNVLKQAKERILNDLQTLDLEGLQKFTFQTEEAEQLKQAIESFKI